MSCRKVDGELYQTQSSDAEVAVTKTYMEQRILLDADLSRRG